MECHKCEHKMKPGVLTQPDAEEIAIWYCDCGYWKEVNMHETGEHMAWKATIAHIEDDEILT